MMHDTITAPATPPGTGALSVIRISGPDTLRVVSSLFTAADKLEPRRAIHGRITDQGKVLDDVILTFFKAPFSFTGEDSAEICCHGNPLIVRSIIKALGTRNVRMSEPGEFTKRAFLNGRLDLTGAEAIQQIIAARSGSEIQAAIKQMHGSMRTLVNSLRDHVVQIKADIECSLDFAHEDIEFISYENASAQIESIEKEIEDIKRRCALGRKVSRGIDLPIAGKPNAGKSSILNMILNSERAIVSDIPGTTRDLIKETIQFGGVHVNLIDTAGIRETDSMLEKIGIEKSEQAILSSGLILVVLDATTGITDEDRTVLARVGDRQSILILNKIDAASPAAGRIIEIETGRSPVLFSAKTGSGLQELEEEVSRIIRDEFTGAEDSFIADERIVTLLDQGIELCRELKDTFAADLPQEIAASTLQALIDALCGITGEITPDDVLNSIFSRFCIGK
jgi:tRNA modification GTPase